MLLDILVGLDFDNSKVADREWACVRKTSDTALVACCGGARSKIS